MSDKKHGLGRGLSALLGDAQRAAAPDGEPRSAGIRTIEVSRIKPNPNQPRKTFNDASLQELADSISQHGIIQPILVRAEGDDFLIIAGERRWRAAQKAQLHAIPVIIRADSDSGMAELALIENVQRQDLNAIEEAEGYRALVDRHGHGQDQIGKMVGKSRSHVANLLRLLDLPEQVRLMLVRGDLTMGHARAVATSPDPLELAQEIVRGGLSVRQAEQLAKRQKVDDAQSATPTRPGRATAVDADLAALERQLGDMLGLKVKVSHAGKGGTVALSYSSLDQLDMICQRLSGEPF
ncbi:MAG: ParB/RepB/Spo0J family partition protein [Sphingomicrobium sp.]